jgi:hypothetical protein
MWNYWNKEKEMKLEFEIDEKLIDDLLNLDCNHEQFPDDRFFDEFDRILEVHNFSHIWYNALLEKQREVWDAMTGDKAILLIDDRQWVREKGESK